MESPALFAIQPERSTLLLLHKMTVCLVMAMVLLISSILTACGTSTAHLLSSDEIAQQVGTHYSETHPKITKVVSTVADPPPHDPMYLMTLTGHFQKGALEAETLSFSALANRMYVWNISAYDQAGNEVWFDRELGPAAPSPSS
jgi:hypothetical protein